MAVVIDVFWNQKGDFGVKSIIRKSAIAKILNYVYNPMLSYT